jgi:type I restriction enzyme S subunit
LEELIDIKTGNKNAEDANEEGQFNFYVRSQQVLKSREYTFDDEGVIFPGEGIFIPHYAKGKFAVHQRVYFLKTNNKEKLLNKYFYY